MSIIKDIFSKYKKIIFKSSSNNENDSEADEEGLIDVKKAKGAKNKKKIENIATFIVILIITVIMINNILKEDTSKNETSNQYKQLVDNDSNSETVTAVANINVQTDLEEELEEILEKMQGVGDVKVLITYSQTSKVIPVYNETNRNSSSKEEDSEGGTRLVSESDISKEVVLDSNNSIITESIQMPEIEGAVVMAKGAKDIEIKNNIIQAVCAATGLSTHKVQVFEMSSN